MKRSKMIFREVKQVTEAKVNENFESKLNEIYRINKKIAL